MKFLSLVLFWLSICAASAITVWPPQANHTIVPANAQEACLQKTREGNLLFSSPGHNLYTKPIAMELEAADWRYLKFHLKSAPATTLRLGMYWQTPEHPEFSEERKISLSVQPQPAGQNLYLPLRPPAWQGSITRFRIDFQAPAETSAEFQKIEFVRNLPEKAAEEVLVLFPGMKLEPSPTLKDFQAGESNFRFRLPGNYGYTAVLPANFPAANWRYLKLRFRAVGSASVSIGTYFQTDEQTKLADDFSASRKLNCTGSWQTAIVDMNTKGHYQSLITGLRLDFGAAPMTEFEVGRVELVNDSRESLPVEWETSEKGSLLSNFLSNLADKRIYRLENPAPGTKVDFFDEFRQVLEGQSVQNNGDLDFSLPAGAMLARIEVPAGNSEPELFDTGRFFTPWKAKWIVDGRNARVAGRYTFRKEFELASATAGRMQLTADDGLILKVNNRILFSRTDNWRQLAVVDVLDALQPGKNTLEVEVINDGDWGGLLLNAWFVSGTGETHTLDSDNTWLVSDAAGITIPASEIGSPPIGPWGDMPFVNLADPDARKQETIISRQEIDKVTQAPRLSIFATPSGNRIYNHDKPIYLCGFKASYPAPEQDKAMTAAGILDFQAANTLFYGNGSADRCWLGIGQYDYTALENSIRDILRINPGARLLISLGIDGPEWWCRSHPDDITGLAPGSKTTAKLSSPASENLRRDVAVFLQHSIRHFESGPFANHIIGYRAVSQRDGGEYQYFCTWGPEFSDFSPVMQKRFRSFLKEKYQGDVKKLAAAWKNPQVTFEKAAVPLPEVRQNSTFLTFRDPDRDRAVIDYLECHALVMADWALAANRVIHEEVPHKLIASYGGYVMFYAQPEREKSGHLAFRKLLDSGLVHLYTPPQDYSLREIGSPAGSMIPHASVRLRKQKLFSENDTRTHFGGNAAHGHANSLFEDIGLLKRDFAFNLVTDSSSYFYDMTGSWFVGAEISKTIGHFNRIGQAALAFRTAPDSQIAIFTDVESAPYLALQARQLSSENTRGLRRELNSAGAGIADDYYLQDLLRDDFPMEQYSVFIFPDLYAPSAEIRAAIDAKCKNRQRTLIFGYGAGMFLEGKLSSPGMAKLTGQTFSIDPTGQVQVPGGYKVGPAITPVTVQIKVFDNWTSIYTPSPELSRQQWRKILQDAGLHIWSDSGDPVYANGRFLAIHAGTAGHKTLKLPIVSQVYDIFEKHPVTLSENSVTVDLLRGETRLYFLGTHNEWLQFVQLLEPN